MDSLYEGPREPPIPIKLPVVNKTPTVSEVSMRENNLLRDELKSQKFLTNNVETQSTRNELYLRQPDHEFYNRGHHRPSASKEDEAPHIAYPDSNCRRKSFREIYMANVPNRRLDLSMLEPQKTVASSSNKPILESTEIITYGKFVEAREEEQQQLCSRPMFNDIPNRYANIYNGQREQPPLFQALDDNVGARHFYASQPQDNKIIGVNKTLRDDEPTMRDLLKIIQQQNEQIILLQKQVSVLQNKLMEQPCDNNVRNFNSPKRGHSKFSIDVKATSVEVSIRPPYQCNNFRRNDPRIEEINEALPTPHNVISDCPENDQDFSLNLDESLRVDDSNCVSLEPSITLNNMENYPGDPDDGENEDTVTNGMIIYRNVMDQVNNVLRMRLQSECQTQNTITGKNNQTEAVKQATLQQLRKMGVNLPPIAESNESASPNDPPSNVSSQTGVSCQVKELLMKYLPGNTLAQIMQRQNPTDVGQDQRLYRPLQNEEFSFATVEYLKKYNIIGTKSNTTRTAPKETMPKIIDTTALKRQPKLL